MSCVYDPEELSFPCIMEIINDVRSGNVSTTTVRKVLKQVDSGLAKFSSPPSTLSVLDEDEICDELEALANNQADRADVGAMSLEGYMKALSLLLSLLELLLGRVQ